MFARLSGTCLIMNIKYIKLDQSFSVVITTWMWTLTSIYKSESCNYDNADIA